MWFIICERKEFPDTKQDVVDNERELFKKVQERMLLYLFAEQDMYELYSGKSSDAWKTGIKKHAEAFTKIILIRSAHGIRKLPVF